MPAFISTKQRYAPMSSPGETENSAIDGTAVTAEAAPRSHPIRQLASKIGRMAKAADAVIANGIYSQFRGRGGRSADPELESPNRALGGSDRPARQWGRSVNPF
jgi:hypothetical protein